MTPSWQGSLAEVSPTKILRTLNQRSATGVLVLKAEDSTYKLFHRGGLVAQVVEEPLDEKTLFGQLLIVETLVSKLELEAGLEQAKEKELPIGQILVKRRSLPASTVGKTLRKQLHGKILKAVRLSEGSFEFFDRVRPPKGPPLPPSNAPRIIFRGSVDTYRVRLRQEMEEIEAPYINEYLYPSESAPDDMFLVGLNDEEVRFWGLCVTGGYTLRDVFNVSNINRRSSHGLVFSLLEMDLVEFKHEMRPELQAKRMQKLLSKKDGQLGKASHFAALEVHWMAHEKELEAAYNARKAEFDCSSIKEHLSPETIAFAKGILARIDEAYKALRSHEARQRHRHEFLEMAQIHFHVDLLLQQGEMAIFKNDRREAEDRFVHVLEIMPGHKEAKAKLQSIRTMPTG